MRYCCRCGAVLAATRYCARCGARTDHTDGASAGKSGSGGRSELVEFGENQLGLLAYITPLPALALLLIEPFCRNRFVRFHSYQCLLLTLASLILTGLTWTLSFMFLQGLLSNLLHLALAAGWVWAAYQAWQGHRWKVPIIGELARRKANALD